MKFQQHLISRFDIESTPLFHLHLSMSWELSCSCTTLHSIFKSGELTPFWTSILVAGAYEEDVHYFKEKASRCCNSGMRIDRCLWFSQGHAKLRISKLWLAKSHYSCKLKESQIMKEWIQCARFPSKKTETIDPLILQFPWSVCEVPHRPSFTCCIPEEYYILIFYLTFFYSQN